MGAKRYEDLTVWQRARSISNEIHRHTRFSRLSSDMVLSQQLNSASNAEVRSLLYLAEDRGYLDGPIKEQLVEETNILGRMLRKLHAHLAAKTKALSTKH